MQRQDKEATYPNGNSGGNVVPKKAFSVSELTSQIKDILETKYPILWIKGEISNYKLAASGHAYFSLKDANAQINAVIFRGQLHQVKFSPEDGMDILGLGRLTVYPPRGNYQVILEHMEPCGIGSLQLAFEKLKKKLKKEGLFDTAEKKPLPFLVKRLCVITSPTGAAIRDILNIALRRFPGLKIDIMPVNVQGRQAPLQVVKALELANRFKLADVIILARGGGSFEDLAPFNDENVARAIFGSKIPVVSAIGHEIDFTIADFVADLRAPTPSAAAELVVADFNEIELRLQELILRQKTAIRRVFKNDKNMLVQLEQRLVHPAKRLNEYNLKIDDLSRRLILNIHTLLSNRKERYRWCCHRLVHNNPLIMVESRLGKLNDSTLRLRLTIDGLLDKKYKKLEKAKATLKALNPTAIVQRGYSIVRSKKNRRIVNSCQQVEKGQVLEVLLSDGMIDVSVINKTEKGR